MKFSYFSYLNRVSLKIEYPKQNLRPVILVGGFLSNFFNTEYERELEVIYPWGDTKEIGTTNQNPFNNADFGISFGFGLSIKNRKDKEIFIDLKFNRGFGILKGLNSNSISLNSGFQF